MRNYIIKLYLDDTTRIKFEKGYLGTVQISLTTDPHFEKTELWEFLEIMDKFPQLSEYTEEVEGD